MSTKPVGPRALARQARLEEIMAVANRQLAEEGAAGLSLRAIAREIGIVSSAIHRYFPTRDDLLTSLIIEAYDSLGEAVERAVAANHDRSPADRWVDAAATIRTWACDQPHRWALLYGTPVPGYAAPERTVDSGIRVSLALLSIVNDAAAQGDISEETPVSASGPHDVDPAHGVGPDLAQMAERVDIAVDPATLLRTLAAWSQLFGLVSLELFGQTRGFVGDDETLFIATARIMAQTIGLSS